MHKTNIIDKDNWFIQDELFEEELHYYFSCSILHAKV